MTLTYRQEGDYQLPNLIPPEAPKIGKYGNLRRSYLMEKDEALYTAMLFEETLNSHLEEIDRQANEMLENLVKEMAKTEGVTEDLKASDQMRWVGLMNNIRASAEEIVLKELIYA